MKSCPTCNRTYPDDTLAFCLMDGSVLSAPYDPAATKSSGSARDTNPPATEVFNPGAALDSLPPTQAAPKDLQSTVHAPFQPQPAHQQQPYYSPHVPDYLRSRSDDAPRKSSIVRKLVIALAVVVVLIIGVFVFLEIMFATHRSTIQNTMPPKANANANASPDAGRRTLADAAADDEAKTREQLRDDPDNAHLNRQLASDLAYEGKYSESETFARTAIRLNSNSSAAHYILSDALKGQNRMAESNAEKKLADKLAAKGQ